MAPPGSVDWIHNTLLDNFPTCNVNDEDEIQSSHSVQKYVKHFAQTVHPIIVNAIF